MRGGGSKISSAHEHLNRAMGKFLHPRNCSKKIRGWSGGPKDGGGCHDFGNWEESAAEKSLSHASTKQWLPVTPQTLRKAKTGLAA